MVYNKIKKMFAVALAASVGVTSLPSIDYYASAATTSVKENSDNSTNQVSLAGNTDISKDDEGVFKVTVDDNGNITADADNEYAADVNTPFSWDNANVYFVMTDRFENGNPDNDHSYGRGLDKSGNAVSGYANKEGYFHGGDLAGMTQKIEDGYFDKLGTNAIWITAPYEQIHGALSAGDKTRGIKGYKHYAYHGYWVLDYTEVDANMGTAEDLEKFIDTAHEHGIRIIFDVVINHAGYANPKDAEEFGYGKLASNWQDIYYNWQETDYNWYNDYVAEASKNGSSGMIDAQNGDWETNWWGSKWVRMREERFGNYAKQAPESDGIETCLDGLPDFITEGTTDPGMPGILKKKWGSEKLAQEEKELDEFCQNYGMSKCVTTYLAKWLTDWVREYGVDGFRCDTAKHVNTAEWGKIKKAGVQALKEWRKNNPDKPGAQWTDDFWMTGEAWNHGMDKDGYYTTGGFDSMINFKYQGNENKTGSGLEGMFSEYAQKINGDPSFNVLSYISSHDTSLGARSANAGTALLLTPGGVQTYYGDESGRQGDGTSEKQPTRSNMNWSSMDEKILSNWQKVGRFRRDHIAVGAGKHTKIAESPYTFSRTYEGTATVGSEKQTDYKDAVVVCLPGQATTTDVTVGDTFGDVTTVRDAYSGATYEIADGKVSGVTCDSNGVILLEVPSEGGVTSKSSVSVSPSGNTYNDDIVTVTLKAKEATDTFYQINDGEKVAYKDGDTVEIGGDTAYEEETTIKVTGKGTDSEGNAIELSKEAKFARGKEPSVGEAAKGFYLRMSKSAYEKASGQTGAPLVWIYDDNGSYSGAAWASRDAMTLDETGEYYVWQKESLTSAVYIIVSTADESWRSVPRMENGSMHSGTLELDPSTKEINQITLATGDPGRVDVKYVDADGKVLKEIYRVGAVDKEYTVYAPETLSTISGYKRAEDTKDKVTGKFTKDGETVEFKYVATGEPIVTVAPPTETPTAAPVTEEPTEAPATEEPTDTPTTEQPTKVPASTGPTVKPTQIPTNVPTASPTVKPTQTPDNNVVTPSAIATNPSITETPQLYKVSLSASPKTKQYKGCKVKLTAKAAGGSGTYKYQFAVEDSTGTLQIIRAYSKTATCTWTPKKTGTYKVVVYAKDTGNSDKVTNTEISFKVVKAPTLVVKKLIVKKIKQLQYQLTTAASGGTGGYKYKFTYTYKGKTKVIKAYSSTKTKKVSLKKKGTYKFTVYIKDSAGTVKKKSKTVKIK